jgi:hypothetical protein
MRASVRRLYLSAAIGIAILTSIVTGANYLAGQETSKEFFDLYNFVMVLILIVWLMTDPDLPREQRPSFDHGMLLWAFFPFLAAYQQFTIRRWRGVGIVCGLLGLVLAPYVTLVIVYSIVGLPP